MHPFLAVGIGIDTDPNAILQGFGNKRPVNIKPVRIGIQLYGDLVPGAGLKHGIPVQRISLATQEQAAGRVPEDTGMRIFDGPHDSLRSFSRVILRLLCTEAITKSNRSNNTSS